MLHNYVYLYSIDEQTSCANVHAGTYEFIECAHNFLAYALALSLSLHRPECVCMRHSHSHSGSFNIRAACFSILFGKHHWESCVSVVTNIIIRIDTVCIVVVAYISVDNERARVRSSSRTKRMCWLKILLNNTNNNCTENFTNNWSFWYCFAVDFFFAPPCLTLSLLYAKWSICRSNNSSVIIQSVSISLCLRTQCFFIHILIASFQIHLHSHIVFRTDIYVYVSCHHPHHDSIIQIDFVFSLRKAEPFKVVGVLKFCKTT